MRLSTIDAGAHRRRRVLGFAMVAALVAVCTPVVTGAGLGAALAAPVTVTGTVSGDHAWDPTTKAQDPVAPSVTVDQVDSLTDQVVHVSWSHFTPSENPAGNFFSAGITNYAVTVLECKGTDPADPTSYVWPDFGPDCYAHPPDDATASHGVGNQVYTLTGADGDGEAYFHVETSVENDFLGCDSTHPCSLVVVPNWGGKQPAGLPVSSSKVDCAKHGADLSFFGQYALDTSLGAACSWSDRIVIPLHFAATPDNCPAKDFAFAAEGAPSMARTVEQWQAGWCVGSKPLTFDFDSGTNEYLARESFVGGAGALTSSTDVAVVNQPVSSSLAAKRKFTYAPVANSAVVVAYHVDNQHTGQLLTNLTLNARLVAKLVTQSYSLDFGCTTGGDTTTQGPNCDPAVKGNPPDIFDDPEFQALNPEYSRADFPSVSLLNRGQFLPLVVSGNSDVVHELTSWIESDPTARAFLAGTADPYGMHVNTYYKDEAMPLDQFEVLDPGYTAPTSNGVPGMSTMQVSWNPLTGLANVSNSLVADRPSAINPTLPACGTAGVPCVYQRFGSQAPGNRALFAIVGSPDAAADRFPTAKLVNGAGTGVALTDAALSAGLADMTANPDGITRTANFRSTDSAQYPLAAVDYAMVPTCGLSASKSAAIKDFLAKVTTSQTVGLAPGQLALGDLGLTAAQLTQTKAAAAKVSTAACSAVPLSAGSGRPSGGHPAGTTGGSTTPTSSTAGGRLLGDPGSGGLGGSNTTAAGATNAAAKPAGSKSDNPSGSAPTTPATRPAALEAYGVKSSGSGGPSSTAVAIALVVLALLLVGGPGTFILVSTGAGAALMRRLRR